MTDASMTKRRDEEKKRILSEHSITLIEIPYYWTNMRQEIINAIKLNRPNLINQLMT